MTGIVVEGSKGLVMPDLKLTDFAKAAEISISYASQLLSEDPARRRVPTLEMAISIYRKTGVGVGLLKGADKREANVVLRLAERNGFK